jgi:hypothetical protein
MRKTAFVLAGVAAAVSLGLVGCDVEKTQSGKVEMPKYEVSKTKEGEVTLPKYDVTTPDVKVGTKEAEVTVPKITTEKETLTVPTIGIKTADEKKAEEAAAAGKTGDKVAQKK